MNHSVFDEELFDVNDAGSVMHLRNVTRGRKLPKARAAKPHPQPTPLPPPAILETEEQSDEKFEITYKAARYEAVWLEESLKSFLQQKWFDDVLRVIKGGKEASVYLCQGNTTTGAEFLAAKVYRPRMFRNLRNDWLYREGRNNLDEDGREIKNKGLRHAIEKRTEFGRELLITSWLEHEYQTLRALHAAGADVPRPYANNPNTILMAYYGDEVMGAPTLNEVDLSVHEARSLFERVLHNIDLMLAHGRIHGDLSAYNILYWEGQIALIDFPQAIDPQENRSAYPIFERDVVRVCEYFQRQGVRCEPRKLAADFWSRHHQRFVPLVDPKALGEDSDEEREIWEELKNT